MAKQNSFKFIDPITSNEYDIKYIPIGKIEPSPFQREISKSLKQGLEVSISKRGFLSVPLVVEYEKDKYYVIDGQHRVEALKSFLSDDNEIMCIVLPPEREFLYCLDFNIERAPNIKEKSRQIYKMFIDEVNNNPDVNETEYINYFELPYYITCGIALEEIDAKFSPSSFESILKKVDEFMEIPIKDSYKERKKMAKLLCEIWEKVGERFAELGLKNYFLKSAIVSKAFQNVYGQRVRIIEDDFFTCFEKIKKEIPKVEIFEEV